MCFSAEASFVSAAILIPAGAYCFKKTFDTNKSYWVFALLPFLFGVQQLMEGIVWLTVDEAQSPWLWSATYGFLFFSHFFWLLWIPLTSLLTEHNKTKRKLFFAFTIAGVVFGASLYLPIFIYPDWLSVSVLQNSIHYDVKLVYDAIFPRYISTLIYALIILLPLLLSSDPIHRVLGVLVAISAFVTWLFYGLAFISVWCFFAAILSLYIFYQIVLSRKKLPLP